VDPFWPRVGVVGLAWGGPTLGEAFGMLMVRPGSDGLGFRFAEDEEGVPKILFCSFFADIACEGLVIIGGSDKDTRRKRVKCKFIMNLATHDARECPGLGRKWARTLSLMW
jgi:hypothetical protein